MLEVGSRLFGPCLQKTKREVLDDHARALDVAHLPTVLKLSLFKKKETWPPAATDLHQQECSIVAQSRSRR
jgi:hypothetical protein